MLPICLLALFAATTVFAQGMGGGNGAGGGQFAQFQAEHKFTFQLMQMTRKIGQIDKDPKYTLTPKQAKQILKVLKPLRKQPKMTQDQAKTALKQLKAILTIDQLNAMARIKQPQRMGGGSQGMGGGRPGGGGFGGAGGGQGNRPRDPNAMKNFNPYYKDPKGGQGFMAQRAKRMDDMFAALQAKAAKAKK